MITHAVTVSFNEAAETDRYRLIVFNRGGTAVILEHCASGYRLPVIEIPKFSRAAGAICEALRNRWRMPAILLFSTMVENTPEAAWAAILECQADTPRADEGMTWVPIREARATLGDREASALEASHAKCTSVVTGEDGEPFSRLGWFDGLKDWVRTMQPSGAELKGFEQMNGSESFSLIRFDTTRGSIWFKAVGAPNSHELPITMKLARLFPTYVPRVLGEHPKYQGWLMEGACGAVLSELGTVSGWNRAAGALAELQIESIDHTPELRESGCRDLRLGNLFGLVDPFLDLMTELMLKQTRVSPARLTRSELLELGVEVKDALTYLSALEFPDALGHSDCNPGNIIVGAGKCTFLDWAEACVGHPLMTFEYLLSHLRKDFEPLSQFESAIRSTYSRRWEAFVPAQEIAEAFRFTPLIAVFAYACSGETWRNQERLRLPQVPAYLRSLTRRMKHEADLLRKRTGTWSN